MAKPHIAFALVTCTVLALGGTMLGAQKAQSPQHSSGGGPVVVELFTSQGCSSCPPADALIARMAREPGVLVITRPVTIWDRLGWRDTLARPANTELQRSYAAHGNDGNGVYTPQAVIAGRDAAVGSDEAAIRRMIARSAAMPAAVAVSGDAAQGYTISVSGKVPAAAQVKAIALRSAVPVRIGSGENGGRAITYANVVSDERVIGQWRGGNASFAVPPAMASAGSTDHLAVIVQAAGGGPIWGAVKLR